MKEKKTYRIPPDSRRRISQLLRYVLCGGAAFLTDYCVLRILYQVLQFNLYVAVAVAFAAGFTVNQVIAVRFVFRGAKANAGKSLRDNLLALAISVAGLIWTEFGMHVGTVLLPADYRLVKVLVSALVMLWNYGMRVAVIYRTGEPQKERAEEKTL